MAEIFTLQNDYTLQADNPLGGNANHYWGITRLFNFKAQQVTTLYREWISFSSGSTVTSQMSTQSFDEIPTKDELRDMHAKLQELGGKPPSLEEVFGDMDKPASLGKKGLAP